MSLVFLSPIYITCKFLLNVTRILKSKNVCFIMAVNFSYLKTSKSSHINCVGTHLRNGTRGLWHDILFNYQVINLFFICLYYNGTYYFWIKMGKSKYQIKHMKVNISLLFVFLFLSLILLTHSK